MSRSANVPVKQLSLYQLFLRDDVILQNGPLVLIRQCFKSVLQQSRIRMLKDDISCFYLSAHMVPNIMIIIYLPLK